MNDNLVDLGEKTVKKAIQLGADQVEAYLSSSRAFSINVENNSIKSAFEKRDNGCGIRSVLNKKIGFAYVTSLLPEDVYNMADKSVKLAKASVADPCFKSLPSFDGAYSEVKAILDSSIKNLTPEEAANLIIRTIQPALDATKGYKVAVSSTLLTYVTKRVIINSLGISGTEESTSVIMYSQPTVKYGTNQTSSFEFQASRNLQEIDPEWIGSTAGKYAIQMFNPKTIEGGEELPVILSPPAVATVIGLGFGKAINAEEIQYGRSYISDAIGESLASDNLHIVDDAIRIGGINSRAFDAEGVSSQKTDILTAGILKNILHNSYTANKDEVNNTANASRPSYKGIPTIGTSNLVLEPNKGTQEELISEIKKGVLCRNTGDRPNMTTGDLSCLIMEGFYIENGEIKHPLKNTLFGINMLELLKKCNRIGEDVRVIPPLGSPCMVTPSIVIEAAMITSG